MLLSLVKIKTPDGRMEHRTWELIEVYISQINSDRLGDTYAPSQLAKFIKNLTSYDDFKDQLLFEWSDIRLAVYFNYYLDKPLCTITWTDC